MRPELVPYEERIAQDPKIMAGKPVIKGTRIPVELVLEELASNPDLEELFGAHPALTVDDVRACLAFAQELVHRAYDGSNLGLATTPISA